MKIKRWSIDQRIIGKRSFQRTQNIFFIDKFVAQKQDGGDVWQDQLRGPDSGAEHGLWLPALTPSQEASNCFYRVNSLFFQTYFRSFY